MSISSRLRRAAIALSFMGCLSFHLVAQEDSGWRISPEKINIQIGADRPLQLLDDSARELHGALWSVDNPELAEIQEENGLVVLHAKAEGIVLVTAALSGEMRSREIKVWPSMLPLPPGTTNRGLHPIGREIGDIPTVPTSDGPGIFSLEQTASGGTYLRADRSDGIQVWTWLMPETNHNVELVCGDWFGGALISSNHPDSYTLYAVGKDGKLRWQHTVTGLRKGLAISLDHVVYLLSQSADGNSASLEGLDELSGMKKFAHPIPGSSEKQASVRKDGARFVCTSGIVSSRSERRLAA